MHGSNSWRVSALHDASHVVRGAWASRFRASPSSMTMPATQLILSAPTPVFSSSVSGRPINAHESLAYRSPDRRIAQIAPNISPGNAEVVDCSGTIVIPGFITTHNHQYESLQRATIPDGLLAGAWPMETYGSVVQNIWTAGRIAEPGNPNSVIWDLGRVPYDPEDLYIAELIACLSQISEGITCGTDTSQANHTPARRG